MTKPDRIRDGGTETEREAKKKRRRSPSSSTWEEMGADSPMSEPDDPAALQHARPAMRAGGTETEREAKKKRRRSPSSSTWEEMGADSLVSEPDDRAALHHARPEMGAVGTESERAARKKRRCSPSSSTWEEMGADSPVSEPDDPAALHHARPEMRAGGTETKREAKKKRRRSPSSSTWEEMGADSPVSEPDDRAALHHARPEMRAVGDPLYDQGESATEIACTQVDEMTKAVGAGEEEQLSSFTPKSPISRPFIPDELNDRFAYPGILAAFEDAQVKYINKLRRRCHLFTLAHKRNVAPSCLFHDPDLHPIRESAKKAVLHAAESIIKLSSSVDGKPLANCCGLWIHWYKESKTGIVLTSAHLIRSKNLIENHWEGYNTKANVIVHLLDGTTAQGHFLYHQEHYDLAFFKVRVDDPVQLPSFNGSVNCGQDVFRLGRDDDMTLRITHGRVEYWNPESDERDHYMYLSHKKNDDYLCDDDGGFVIDLGGKVVGLVNKDHEQSFVPSSVLNKCLDLWWKFRCIPRLQLGMKFSTIRHLDPIHIDKMWRMYKIKDGLIVEEVSEDSHAEQLGICLGDVIERFNGECICTTIELENMLLGRCRDHFDQGNHLNAKIDVSIQVFHTEERLRRTVNLMVDVSDGGEVIRRRTYPITATEGTSATVQSIQSVADDPWLARPAFTWEARSCT